MRKLRNKTTGKSLQTNRQLGAAVAETLENRLHLSTSVLTYRDGTAGIGVNSSETILNTSNVKVGSFGKLFSTPLDGQVYAEPLVDASVTIANGVNTSSGAAGVHSVAFVPTENDSLYAIDTSNGNILWMRSFLSTTNSGGNQNNTLGATSIQVVTSSDVNSTDISPSIGITSTPVIDASTGILYCVAATKETIGGNTTFVQRLHAIKISDGTDAVAPYVIGQTTNGNTNTTAIYVYGTGDGAVTDPYNNTGQQVVQFNALTENQRAALSLVNGRVYVSWASHGDNGPYHGWVCTWDVSQLSTKGFVLDGVLNTCPNNGLAGIWSGGGALAFESDGSAFYFVTGNGYGGGPTVGSNGLPTDANYNEAVVKAVIDNTTTATSQGPNGWGLKVVDFFIPYNVTDLDNADSDFGSGDITLLPDSAGIAGHPHLLVVGGKDGRVFVLDRDNLGGYNATNDNAINSVPNGSGNNTAPNLISGLLSTPAWFNNQVYAVSGYTGPAYAYTLSSTGTLTAASQTSQGSFGYVPGSPFISSDGTTNGIVWQVDTGNNELHAFDASTFNTELWNSTQAPGNSDSLGSTVKFASPTVANGEVFVGTQNSLVVYGLPQPATTVPKTPVLAATALSGSAINLTWTDSTQVPDKATTYDIEESPDNKAADFKQVATAPAGATSIAIGQLNKTTTYYFRIRGNNAVGNSAYSNTASATTTNAVALIDYSGGFAGQANTLAINGSTTINGANLRLTDGGSEEASSAYYPAAVDITRFSSQFDFQISAGSSTGDGFTFCIQNAGTTAIGPAGGGLGYGPDTPGGTPGIASSVAIKFDLYSNAGEGSDSTGLYADGASPTTPDDDLSSTGIDLHSGDVMQVNVSYDGTTLTEIITDTSTKATVTETYAVNIPSTVGSNAAYVGFTAGTGGDTATQDIQTWTYSPNAAVSPNAPTGLGATAASGKSVALTWTNNAANQAGYHLDRATNANFTQNLVTEDLPPSPASFTDTQAGLTAGGTYYYRIRAYNSAGDSGNSNVASVTIPLPPPAATKQVVTNVLTNEIDISWQDNAGHAAQGYYIFRSANHGAYTQAANLPPTSRKAPSTYLWSDKNLTAGTLYSYEIEAYNVAGSNAPATLSATTLAAAPTNVVATGKSGSVLLTWTAPAGAVSYDIYRATTAGGEGMTPIATKVAGTSWTDPSVVNGTKYYYVVAAVNANATATPTLPSIGTRSSEASATPIYSPFNKSADIGSPSVHGSSNFANGVYTISGAGRDISGASDQFQFDYASVAGDHTLVANVTSLQNVNTWSKAGVMFRATTAANSAFADIVLTPTGKLQFQYRAKTGASVTAITITPKSASKWLKLTRKGNVFTAYYSADGKIWTQGGSVTISMTSAITAGLAVTSVNPSVLCTATFASVALS